MKRVLFALMMLYSLAMPFSISLSETPGLLLPVLSILFLLRPVRLLVGSRLLSISSLLLLVYALLMVVFGWMPEGSAHALHRLVAFLNVIAFPLIVLKGPQPDRDILWVVRAFLLGVVILGIQHSVELPLELRRGVSLFDTGNMTDPQFFMTALVLVSALGPEVLPGRARQTFLFLCLLYIGGLLIHFKRGAWIAASLACMAVIALKRKVVAMLWIVAVAGLALCLPATRMRLTQLRELPDVRVGGRWALWTEAAPGLIRDHPWGVGFKQSSHELLLQYTRNIQPGLDHLHNNLLQIPVELGWIGLILWLLVNGVGFAVMLGNLRAARELRQPALNKLSIGLLAAFFGLHINGLVEYNVGDMEILLLYSWILGMAATVHARLALYRNEDPSAMDGRRTE